MDHYFTDNTDIKSEIKEIIYNIEDVSLKFKSDNGVFSKQCIDYGSSLLIKGYLENNTIEKSILDVGCGYGVIGISIVKLRGGKLVATDVNSRCVHLTNMNIKDLKVNGNAIYSNIYEEVNQKFDVVITNPPIRAGKSVYLSILENAYKYLNDDGELWFVIRKDQGKKSIMEYLSHIYDLSVMKKDAGYFVVKAKKC
ncbi:MAG: methyltransferase [Bacilli bacterium]